MPKVAEFFGIAIYLYYDDHPPAHFHARYQGDWARIAIDDLAVINADVSARALGLVLEWARMHQDELRHAWEQAMASQPVLPIEPLR